MLLQDVETYSVRDGQREETGGIHRHFRKELSPADNEQEDRSAGVSGRDRRHMSKQMSSRGKSGQESGDHRGYVSLL